VTAPTPGFKVIRSRLTDALGLVGPAVPRRTTLPALRHVFVRATPAAAGQPHGFLRLSATDMDLWVTSRIPADVTLPEGVPHMDYLLPADQLAHIAATATSADLVEVGASAGRVSVKVGRSRFTVPSLPAEEWPKGKTYGTPAPVLRLPAELLVAALTAALPARSTEISRPGMNAVAIDLTKPLEASVVAVDGHRMHWTTIPMETGAPAPTLPVSFSLPPSAVAALLKAFGGQGMAEALVTVQALSGQGEDARSAAHLRFLTPSGVTEVITRLVGDPFPPWRSIVREKAGPKCLVDRLGLLGAVGVVDVKSYESYSIVLTFEAGSLTLAASDPERGDARDTIPATYEEALPGAATLTVNARYLEAALRAVPGERVRLSMGGDVRDPLFVDSELEKDAPGRRTRAMVVPIVPPEVIVSEHYATRATPVAARD
jgi:DNA polymerase-3 subunit beta